MVLEESRGETVQCHDEQIESLPIDAVDNHSTADTVLRLEDRETGYGCRRLTVLHPQTTSPPSVCPLHVSQPLQGHVRPLRAVFPLHVEPQGHVRPHLLPLFAH